MKDNIVLTLAYDGTPYFGWQKTRSGPSIESTLEEALARLLGSAPPLQAASRTDRGVHAHGQIVNFFWEDLPYSLESLSYKLNAILPASVRVLSIHRAPLDFHPSTHATAKEYHYFVSADKVQLPFDKNYAWHCYYPLNLERMQEAAKALLGERDFKALCNQQPQARENTRRTLLKCGIVPEGRQLRFEIKADRFLYKMARNLVGSLVAYGMGRLQEPPHQLIEKGDRRDLGMTAPAHGLFLHHLDYLPQ